MTPMTMPTKPSIEPTDRSILRVTMTSTMPVAITAIDDGLDRQRFQRLRGVRNSPPEMNAEDRSRSATRAPRPCPACGCRVRWLRGSAAAAVAGRSMRVWSLARRSPSNRSTVSQCPSGRPGPMLRWRAKTHHQAVTGCRGHEPRHRRFRLTFDQLQAATEPAATPWQSLFLGDPAGVDDEVRGCPW